MTSVNSEVFVYFGIIMIMLVFISGSVNAGKSTTAELLAKKIDAVFIDFDDLTKLVSHFKLEEDIPKVFEVGIKKINQLDAEGKSVVAAWGVRPQDHDMLRDKLTVKEQFYITLAPRFEIALSDRGRGMNNWELKKIKYHYDTGMASPSFGEIIDNSDMNIEQTTSKILDIISK